MFVPPLPDLPEPRLRLLCLPFAGGGAGIYTSWQGAMPPGVQVVPLRLPGREQRLREPAYTSMRRLVDDLLPSVEALADVPWAVFGHSMGGAIAHELALATAAEGFGPEHLFVSARRAPGVPAPHPPLFELPRDVMIEEVERRYGPFPPMLRRHPGLLDTFLPTLRADLRLIDTWEAPTDRPLVIPVTAYGGVDDEAVPPHVLDDWARATTGPFRKVVLPGGHFTYVRDAHGARDDVAATLSGS